MIQHTKTLTDDLLQAANHSTLFVANRPQVVMERGEGMYMWDTDGNKYLDFIGGWAVTCLGHAPQVVSDALAEQAGKLVHAGPGFYNKPMVEFARMLTSLTGLERVFFGSTGAEANESAIKLARKYGAVRKGGAYEIITAKRSFHGRSLATMAATGKPGWETMFTPQVPGFVKVSFNDIEAVKSAVNEHTCAVMLELIQGEGGVYEANVPYIQELRKLCDENGILLIFDEVQTGIGRTGTMFGYQYYGVLPDVLTLAKGIGGGFPLSAMLTKEAYNLFEPGDQGGTYTGQPLAMAVGLAVVSEVLRRGLPQQAAEQGAYLLSKLYAIQDRYGLQEIRGKGLLLGFDLPRPCGAELAAICMQAGLLINSPNPKTIRLMPALIVTKDDIDDMIRLLSEALDQCLLS
ncbi:aspartate aminotransferase family protein [Paenibacillus sp. GCM10023248]|uniref:aspartate aminotransferase family protein n=1 Tax=Bacillales TaxID=1385 RepID=UPI00237917B7|nr:MULTISPECIES: aspartate aminotransferase family protein [Bacillales]MDD9268776.1 aspartate aminotransferase family protein [Paenibacillus sp. MAHUQ-63]MDR6882145.1 acetylornithine/N-succinyldiaminopimelate aminotransferase [Bacillus sp. 3255]